jgi:hypothetical protein
VTPEPDVSHVVEPFPPFDPHAVEATGQASLIERGIYRDIDSDTEAEDDSAISAKKSWAEVAKELVRSSAKPSRTEKALRRHPRLGRYRGREPTGSPLHMSWSMKTKGITVTSKVGFEGVLLSF